MRGHRVHQIANQLHDADIRPFIVPANVVGLRVAPAGEHLPERLRMVAHVKPVPHVQPVAIDRKGLAVADRLDDDRNQFLRELVGAVVVGAIGRHHRQTVSVVIGAHQQVAGGLARRVGRIGRVGRGFRKISGRAQAAIDFIGGNMVETAVRLRISDFGLRIGFLLSAFPLRIGGRGSRRGRRGRRGR